MDSSGNTAALAVDIAIGVAFLVFAVIKGRKGLYAALVPFVVMLLALAGAGFVADVLTEPLSKPLIPIVAERIAGTFDPSELLPEAKEGGFTSSAGDYIDKLEEQLPDGLRGILDLKELENSLTGLIDGLRGKAQVNTERLVREAAQAMAEELVPRYLHVALFVAGYIVLWLLLNALSKVLGITFKLPILSAVNALGGAAVGIAECWLIVFLIVWAADKLGYTVFQELEAQSMLLKYFFVFK